MTIRPIIAVPDPRLKQVSEPVEAVTDDLRLLMDDMVETMHDAKGIGLAAIQVGVGKRVIVMDLSPSDSAEDGESEHRYDLSELKDEPIRYFVNPEVVWTSEEMNNYQEGCLSVPGFYDHVERPQACKVTYLDYQGEPQELNCDGLLATCIQHEMDHLNGVVFLDHLSRLKRDMIVKKLRKLAKEANVVESR
jgi:peptide deformylase